MALRTDQTESTSTFGNHAEDHRATNVQVNQNTTDITNRVKKDGDTMTGPLLLSVDPTVDLQAATKHYVDTHGGGGGGGTDTWGAIVGNLNDQTDLAAALATKALDSAVLHLTGTETVAGIKTFSSSPVAPTPTSGSQVATKSYVDAVAAGISNAKTNARLATAAPLPANTYSNGTAGVGATLTATANGALSVDGVTVAVSDRILVKDEVAGGHNGIYVVTAAGDGSHPYALTRTSDADTSAELIGANLFVLEGTNADKNYLQTTLAPITVGTTALVFIQIPSDATTTSKGIVQLAGDLGGSAASPVVLSKSGGLSILGVATPHNPLPTSDNFNLNIIDPILWTAAGDDPTQVTAASGQLQITHSTGPQYNSLNGLFYDLTGTSTYIQVVDAGNMSLASHQTVFGISKDSNNAVWITALAGQIGTYKKIGGTVTNFGTNISYSSTTHAWWRIRESGGTLYFDTAPNSSGSPGTWTTRWSLANPFAITSVQPYAQSGCYNTEASTSHSYFDNWFLPINSDATGPVPFVTDANRNVNIIMFYQTWGDTPKNNFSYSWMDAITNFGAIPMVTWQPSDGSGGVSVPSYSLSHIIAGDFDTYIQNFATQAAAWGKPFYLRFGHEMNGNFNSWSEGVNGNTAGQYVTAWRHVYNTFTAICKNAIWVWAPNVNYSGSTALAGLYPGDAYVDWMGMDGYNWGNTFSHTWTSFTDVFQSTYNDLVKLSTKPLMITETGSAESGGNKANWITDALLSEVYNFPRVKGLIWFNYNKENDWRIESSAAAQTAFKQAINTTNVGGERITTASTSVLGTIQIAGDLGGTAALPYTKAREANFVIAPSTSAAGSADYVCAGLLDQSTFQAALDALPSTGGKIYVRGGGYFLSSNFTIRKSNVEVEFALDAVLTLTAANSKGVMLIGSTAVTSVDNVYVHGGILDGGNISGVSNTAALWGSGSSSSVYSTTNVRIDGTIFRNCGGTSDSSNLTVTATGVSGFTGGRVKGLTVTNCTFDTSADSLLYLAGNYIADLTIRGNTFKNGQGNSINYFATLTETASNWRIENNTFVNTCLAGGIDFNTGFQCAGVDLWVTNNTFDHSWESVYTTTVSIFALQLNNWRRAKVTGNKFLNLTRNTISIGPSFAGSTFSNQGNRDIEITGNHFEGCWEIFDGDWSERVKFAGNKLVECGLGLKWYANHSHSVVEGNEFYNMNNSIEDSAALANHGTSVSTLPEWAKSVFSFSPTDTTSVRNNKVIDDRLLTDPGAASVTLADVAGGSLSGTTYYVKIAYVNAAGDTTNSSTETSRSVSANRLLTVQVGTPAGWNTSSYPTGSAGIRYINIYVGTSSGAEKLEASLSYYSLTNTHGVWTMPSTGLLGTGATAPSSNSTHARTKYAFYAFAGGYGSGPSMVANNEVIGVKRFVGSDDVSTWDQATFYANYLNGVRLPDKSHLRLDQGYDFSQALSKPTGLAGTVSGSGGTLAAGTYYYMVTAIDALGGETLPSVEINKTTTGSTSSIALTWTAVTGAASYRIYRGTQEGDESVYFTSGTNSYTDTNASSTSGTPPNNPTAYVNKLAASGNSWITGNLGIGKNNPSTALDVNGTATATTFAGSGASLTGIPESAVTNLTTDLASKAPLASPTFTGTVTTPGLDLKTGSDAAGSGGSPIAIEYNTGGYKHFIRTKHDTNPGTGNGIEFYLNTNSSSGGSSAPGTGNILGLGVYSDGTVQLYDSGNIVLGTSTGTKIGTSTSQKLGFFNSTPIVKPSGNLITALSNLGLVGSGSIAAGDVPTLNQNTTGSAATLTTPRAIYGNNFDGSAALTGIIASTYGGTGNGFTKFSGPGTSEKTFTLPNASATILTDNAVVTPAQGGTGVANSKNLTVSNSLTLAGTDSTVMTFPSTSATIARTDAAQTFTGVQTLSSSPVLSSGAVTVSGNAVTFPTSADTLVARATTDTLTNKRITPRVTTISSSATPAINTDNCDAVTITALAADITSMTSSLSGTPNNFDKLIIRIKDNGTARAITWGASFQNSGVATLPATTVVNKVHTVGLMYDSVAATWVCLAADTVGY